MRKAVLFALGLAGCTGMGDPHYDIDSARQSLNRNAIIGYHNRCISFGAEPGTSLYEECVATLQEADMRAEVVRTAVEPRVAQRRPQQ